MINNKRHKTINFSGRVLSIYVKKVFINPLMPRRTQVSPFTEINSILRRDHQKKIL